MVGLRKRVCNWLFAVLVLFSCVYTYIMFLASSNYNNQKSLKDVKLTVLNSFDAEKIEILKAAEKHEKTVKSSTATRMLSATSSRSEIDLIATKSSAFMNHTTTTLAKPIIKVHRPPLIVGKVIYFYCKLSNFFTCYFIQKS